MVHTIVWTEEQVEPIAAHNVTPEEFEEVCFSRSLVLRTKSTGKNPIYHRLGQTDGGVSPLCGDSVSQR